MGPKRAYNFKDTFYDWLLQADMARTFEFVLHLVRCVTVTVSPNQIIITFIMLVLYK